MEKFGSWKEGKRIRTVLWELGGFCVVLLKVEYIDFALVELGRCKLSNLPASVFFKKLFQCLKAHLLLMNFYEIVSVYRDSVPVYASSG